MRRRSLRSAAPKRRALGAAVAGLLLVGLAGVPAGATVPGDDAAKRVAWQQLLHKGNNAQARSVAIHGDLVTAAGFTTTDQSSPRMTVRTYDVNTGKQIWHDTLPGVSIAQQVAAADGIVAVAGFTLSNGQLSGFLVRAYDAKTGKMLWADTQSPDRDHQGHATAIAISGGKVYAAGYTGACPFFAEPGCSAILRAYDAKSGAHAWESFAGLPTGFSSFSAIKVVDGVVYAAGGTSDLLRLYESGTLLRAYDGGSGLLKWSAPVTTSDNSSGGNYEVGTSLAIGHGLVAVGGKTGSLDTTAWAVHTYDVTNGLPKWSDKLVGANHRQDAVNGVAFTDNRLVAVGLSSQSSGAQTFLVRGYDLTSGAITWSDRVSSAEKKIAQATENDDHSNQLESALTVVSKGSTAYVSGRIGETCDGVAPGNCDMLVRAYDQTAGKALWSDRFDRAGYDDVGQSLALSGNKLVVAGRSTSTDKYGYQAYWMVRAYKA